ncbi:MAG: Lrp/AsnC family transcriptional regulator [Candidatus Bathyarchaeum sp.]|nr:MAG: Lrp/AsnC family transcriptional regulator [Candidatus Bathyarchaeum sp.]
MKKYLFSWTVLLERREMNCEVELDEIDVKILEALIIDARTKLKKIAEDCGISSNAIVKRIKHLKRIGVITGTAMFLEISKLGYTHIANIGINLDYAQENQVVKLIEKRAQKNLVELSSSIGKYDMCALIFTKSMHELDNITQAIRKHPGVKRIAINIYVAKPHFSFENLDLQPTRV